MVAALLGGTASAQALHPLKPDGALWKTRPNADQMAEYYPAEARRKEVSGWSVIECQTQTTGDLKDCLVLGEAPAGLGFGAAGLKLSQYFKMDPRKASAEVLAGGVVTIPILMQTPDGARTQTPAFDVSAGQPSVLLTAAKGGNLPCPSSAAPTQTCIAHRFSWAAHPGIVETAPLIRAASASPETTRLICPIGADMKLTGCMLAGQADPSQIKAMDDLLPMFTAPTEAEDKAPAKNGFVLMQFDWPALKHAVETSVLTRQP